MLTTTLGSNGPTISKLGLGAWAIGGGGYIAGWGPQDDEVSIATLHQAIDDGYTWIDTAAIYGLGRSEEVVGRAIADRRDRVFIATKCTNRWHDDRSLYRSGKAASIKEECDLSLKRLGIDHIDLYQIHRPPEDVEIEETWAALCELQDAGKVRHVGVSNTSVELMERCAAIRRIDSNQPGYSLINRGIEKDVLPYCQANDIAVIPYGPMAEGLLSGTFDLARIHPEDVRNSQGFQAMLPRAREAVELLRPLAAELGWTVGQLAIAWAMAHPAVTSVIVGARRPEQATANAVPAMAALPADLRDRVEQALSAATVS